MAEARKQAGEMGVAILARLLGNDRKPLSPDGARAILELGLSDEEKARMHDLAVRNQRGELSPPEEEELLAFGKAGDILAILKSRARRALKATTAKRTGC